MLKTLVMTLALLAPAANAAQIETQCDETTIAGAADTPLEHDCACLTAETCEDTETMSKTEPDVTLPNGTILDSSKHHRAQLGCGWAEHRTTTSFQACPRCGGEVSNCWVRDGDGPELMTWACVQRTEPRLSFGGALEQLKAGARIAREGWNGKGMWLVLIKPGNAMHRSSAGSYDMQPCIGMKTAQNAMQPGWLASQADMLADDWVVVS